MNEPHQANGLAAQFFEVEPGIRQLFPLPLVPFETIMIIDDRDDYPMTAQLDLHFSGQADWGVLHRSIRLAVARHPLLYALLEQKRNGYCWVMPSGDARVSVVTVIMDQSDRDKLIEEFDSPLDLLCQPGVKFLLVETGDGLELRIRVHHACSDGIGLNQLVEDILTIYQQESNGDTTLVGLRELDSNRLSRRGKFPMVSRGLRKNLNDFVFGFVLAHRFGRDIPNPIAVDPKHDSATAATQVCAPLEDDFTHLLAPLRKKSAQAGVTLNDLLIRDLFLTIREWNKLKQPYANEQRYRIMMPCNLRGPDDVALPAANRMSYSFLSRETADLEDADALLDGIRGETEYIRTENASLYFIRSLQVARRLPGGIRRVTNSKRCLSTLLVSNLGDPTRLFKAQFERKRGKIVLNGLVLERICGRPPLRPLTRIGMVVNTYANQLSIGCAFSRQLSEADQREFLKMYEAHLSSSAEC